MKQYIVRTIINDYRVDIDSTNEELLNSETYDIIHLEAEDGKVIRRISTGEILTEHISLGTNDSVKDFEEV